MSVLLPTSLPAAVSGELLSFSCHGRRVCAYVAGEGPPMVLVHSINATASAAEVRPLHEYFRHSHTVFSIDLPGFGQSDRSDAPYTARVMTDALLALLPVIEARCGPGPVDGLALSLSCEFLARAAAEAPAAWRSVALVSPTGFSGTKARRGPPGSSRGLPWLHRALRGPGSGWGAGLYRGLTRPGVVRYFLEKTWGSRQIDEGLWQYDLLSARQPGAHHAPLYFLSAILFSADINTLYEQLGMPVWMSHGTRGDFTDYRGKRLVNDRPNWRFTIYPAGALPYFEMPELFCADYANFLADPSG
jgi:pimeloyl-ACP methyl ester carboxylesterase